ncbi:hypothetical protein ACLOJK_019218 [Asimina triloba]
MELKRHDEPGIEPSHPNMILWIDTHRPRGDTVMRDFDGIDWHGIGEIWFVAMEGSQPWTAPDLRPSSPHGYSSLPSPRARALIVELGKGDPPGAYIAFLFD